MSKGFFIGGGVYIIVIAKIIFSGKNNLWEGVMLVSFPSSIFAALLSSLSNHIGLIPRYSINGIFIGLAIIFGFLQYGLIGYFVSIFLNKFFK